MPEPEVSLSAWNKATRTHGHTDGVGPSRGGDVFTFFKPNSEKTGWRVFRGSKEPGTGSWKRGEGRESGEGGGAGRGAQGCGPIHRLVEAPGSANWALCLSFLRAAGPVRNRASLLGLVKGQHAPLGLVVRGLRQRPWEGGRGACTWPADGGPQWSRGPSPQGRPTGEVYCTSPEF